MTQRNDESTFGRKFTAFIKNETDAKSTGGLFNKLFNRNDQQPTRSPVNVSPPSSTPNTSRVNTTATPTSISVSHGQNVRSPHPSPPVAHQSQQHQLRSSQSQPPQTQLASKIQSQGQSQSPTQQTTSTSTPSSAVPQSQRRMAPTIEADPVKLTLYVNSSRPKTVSAPGSTASSALNSPNDTNSEETSLPEEIYHTMQIMAKGHPKDLPGVFHWYRIPADQSSSAKLIMVGISERPCYSPSVDDAGSLIGAQWFPAPSVPMLPSGMAMIGPLVVDPQVFSLAMNILRGNRSSQLEISPYNTQPTSFDGRDGNEWSHTIDAVLVPAEMTRLSHLSPVASTTTALSRLSKEAFPSHCSTDTSNTSGRTFSASNFSLALSKDHITRQRECTITLTRETLSVHLLEDDSSSDTPCIVMVHVSLLAACQSVRHILLADGSTGQYVALALISASMRDRLVLLLRQLAKDQVNGTAMEAFQEAAEFSLRPSLTEDNIGAPGEDDDEDEYNLIEGLNANSSRKSKTPISQSTQSPKVNQSKMKPVISPMFASTPTPSDILKTKKNHNDVNSKQKTLHLGSGSDGEAEIEIEQVIDQPAPHNWESTEGATAQADANLESRNSGMSSSASLDVTTTPTHSTPSHQTTQLLRSLKSLKLENSRLQSRILRASRQEISLRDALEAANTNTALLQSSRAVDAEKFQIDLQRQQLATATLEAQMKALEIALRQNEQRAIEAKLAEQEVRLSISNENSKQLQIEGKELPSEESTSEQDVLKTEIALLRAKLTHEQKKNAQLLDQKTCAEDCVVRLNALLDDMASVKNNHQSAVPTMKTKKSPMPPSSPAPVANRKTSSETISPRNNSALSSTEADGSIDMTFNSLFSSDSEDDHEAEKDSEKKVEIEDQQIITPSDDNGDVVPGSNEVETQPQLITTPEENQPKVEVGEKTQTTLEIEDQHIAITASQEAQIHAQEEELVQFRFLVKRLNEQLASTREALELSKASMVSELELVATTIKMETQHQIAQLTAQVVVEKSNREKQTQRAESINETLIALQRSHDQLIADHESLTHRHEISQQTVQTQAELYKENCERWTTELAKVNAEKRKVEEKLQALQAMSQNASVKGTMGDTNEKDDNDQDEAIQNDGRSNQKKFSGGSTEKSVVGYMSDDQVQTLQTKLDATVAEQAGLFTSLKASEVRCGELENENLKLQGYIASLREEIHLLRQTLDERQALEEQRKQHEQKQRADAIEQDDPTYEEYEEKAQDGYEDDENEDDDDNNHDGSMNIREILTQLRYYKRHASSLSLQLEKNLRDQDQLATHGLQTGKGLSGSARLQEKVDALHCLLEEITNEKDQLEDSLRAHQHELETERGKVATVTESLRLVQSTNNSSWSQLQKQYVDLKHLANALTDDLNDKSLALEHMRKSNKLLGTRVHELEKKFQNQQFNQQVQSQTQSQAQIDSELEPHL